MIAGTAYGVVLNDADERTALAGALADAPYKAPPVAPVVYIKPRGCMTRGGAPVILPADAPEARLSATIGLLFARDAAKVAPEIALAHVGAVCLAADISLAQRDYYRPAIAQTIRDGFLPLGEFAAMPDRFGALVTRIDGVDVHRWSLDRLVRPLGELIAALGDFMTLRAGDLLLVGLPGDAPLGRVGQRIDISCEGLPALNTRLIGEVA